MKCRSIGKRKKNRKLSMRNIFQFWCPGEREQILPQEREELSFFICVTWLYSCTVFQQILSHRAASKVGCVWYQFSSYICHPGSRGFSSQPLIIRCTWGFPLVYIFLPGFWLLDNIFNKKYTYKSSRVAWVQLFIKLHVYAFSAMVTLEGIFRWSKPSQPRSLVPSKEGGGPENNS